MRTRLAWVVLSVALHSLAMPPFDWWGLAWVALVPLFLALHGCSVRTGLALGLLWGTGAIWGVGHWVPSALAFYYQQPLWFGVAFALAASILFAGIYSAGFAACWCLVAPHLGAAARPWLGAIFWVAWELARARLFTGEPWLLLGYAMVPSLTFAQAAELGGVSLLSFMLVVANASLAEALRAWTQGRAPWAGVAGALAVPALCAAYGVSRLQVGLPADPSVRVAVVQGNVDADTHWRAEHYGKGFEQYLELSAAAARHGRPDLIVWPESALNVFLAGEPGYRRAIGQLLEATGSDLIVGGPYCEACESEHPRYFNSVFALDASGSIRGRYDKTHLLPFAEYFPLKTGEILGRRFDRVRWFTPGEEGVVLATRFGPVATVVCFEAVFPELVRRQMRRGATLLLNLSNDVWLGTGAGPAQHFAMVRLRAIEHRTWVIRSTTTGITAIIDPFGRVVERAAVDEPATITGEVVPRHAATLYQAVGDVVAFGCVVAAFAAVGWGVWRREQPRASRLHR